VQEVVYEVNPQKEKEERDGKSGEGEGREVGVEERRRRKGLGHTAQEKCQAVLTLWTERRKPGEVCREMGVAWGVLQQWQDRAMEGCSWPCSPGPGGEEGGPEPPSCRIIGEEESGGLLRGWTED